VGLAGILVAGLGGWRDRISATNLAETARKQQRLAEAYVELIELAEKIGYWASRLRPVMADLDYQPPEPPSLDEQMRVGAKVLAYGTKDVKVKWKSWQQCVNEIVNADLKVRIRLDMSEQHKHYQPKPGEDMSWRDPLTPWGKIHDEYLPAEVRAREALTEQATKELS